MGLEQVLVALSFALLVAQLLAWRWSIGIERRLEGQDGHAVARLLTQIIGWTTVARIFAILSVAILGIDRANLDTSLALAFVAHVCAAGVFGWAAWRVRQISRESDDYSPDTTHAERAESLEGVSVQIDQIGIAPAVAVDDLGPDAAGPSADLNSRPS